MKTKLFLFFVTLMVSFASCEPIGVTPINNYKEAWDVMQMYLSKNYTEGDSLVFYNESLNVLDTFVVLYSGAMLMKQANDTNYTDNEELGYIVYDTVFVESYVQIKNEEYIVDASFGIMRGDAISNVSISKGNELLDSNKTRTDLDLTLLMSGINDYTITNPLGQSCYLRKNEGIISFSDEKGNTWTKK